MEPIPPIPQKRKREGEMSPAPPEDAEHDASGQVASEQPSCSDAAEETSSRSPDDACRSYSSSTHDTAASSFHFESIHDFTKELQEALMVGWKTRNDLGCSKYDAVK